MGPTSILSLFPFDPMFQYSIIPIFLLAITPGFKALKYDVLQRTKFSEI